MVKVVTAVVHRHVESEFKYLTGYLKRMFRLLLRPLKVVQPIYHIVCTLPGSNWIISFLIYKDLVLYYTTLYRLCFIITLHVYDEIE